MGDCGHCGERAGFLRGKHRECEAAYLDGQRQLAEVASEAAATPNFHEAALFEALAAIANRSWSGDDEIRAAIAEGWRHAVRESLADGILTQEEEARLREFRERVAIQHGPASREGAQLLDRASRDRLMLDARLAALAVEDGDRHLHELGDMLANSGLTGPEQRSLLAQAWEAAVDGSLEDGALSLDEEAALLNYLRHFEMTVEDVNANGAHRDLVKSAVIREAAEGLTPDRVAIPVHPFNLLKSEKLVRAFDQVEYHEIKTRRERRGTSHGLSIRVAKGLYYRPGTFRSQAHEGEESVHADTGILGITNKHIYFHGPRKRFRVRYNKIVSFEPFADGIGIMRDAQTAKPQTFITGDGWFTYNLVTNLAQNEWTVRPR